MKRFEKIGMSYRFAPDELPIVLQFSRPERNGDTWEVRVGRRDGGHTFTRRFNLLTSPRTGTIKATIDELIEDKVGTEEVLRKLLREACESVLASHRNGREAHRTQGRIARPAAPAWLCRGLLLKNKPNTWLGAASTGKSTLAKAMCAYYATGFRFCDREMEQGVPLYLDWEDDYESFNRTVFDVCRNLGVLDLPPMVWLDMHGYRLRDQVEAITRLIERDRIGLLVLDAVAASGGSPNEHLNYEGIALEMSECLDALPPVTVLALDHVTSEESKDVRRNGKWTRPSVPTKARGSVRKLEYFRNQWTLMPDVEAEERGEHIVRWAHTKLNLAAKERPGFVTEILHLPDEISIRWHPDNPMPTRGFESEDGTKTAMWLAALGATSGRTARELFLEVTGKEASKAEADSVYRLLKRAVERGAAYKLGSRFQIQAPDDFGVVLPFDTSPNGAP